MAGCSRDERLGRCRWDGSAGCLAGVHRDELPRALEIVRRHQDLARAAVADGIAGTCTHVCLAVPQAIPSVRKRPQIVSASIEFPTTMSWTAFICQIFSRM